MEVILKSSSKYAKIMNCTTGYTFYKDKPTTVPDDYKIEESEMKIYGTEEKPQEKQEEEKPKVEVINEEDDGRETIEVDDFDSLLEIKGIGKETLEDIKRLYPTLTNLKQALKENKVPLRNDVVTKLSSFLK